MSLGEHIEELRIATGLSHDKLARKIAAADVLDEHGDPVAVSGAAIWRIEQGIYNPSLATLQALAVGLDVRFVITRAGIEIEQGGKT